MAYSCWMILVAFLTITKGDVLQEAYQETRLHEDLFGNRTEADLLKPVYSANHSNYLEIGISLIRLFDLDAKSSTLETELWLRTVWYDYGLHWDEAEYGGINVIRINSKMLWRPDVNIENSVEDLHNNFVPEKFNALIYPNSMVLWIPSRRVKTLCSVQLRNFPFDEQECFWKISPVSETGDDLKVKLYNEEEEIDLSELSESTEWIVTGSSGSIEKDQDAIFVVRFKRKYGYYVFSLLVPLGVTWIMILALFWLPPNAEGKVTIAAFCTLYLIIVLISIYYVIPHNGSDVPRILMFAGISLVFFFLALLFSLFSVCLSRDCRSSIPKCLTRLVNGSLGRKLCLDPATKEVSMGARFDSGKGEVTVTKEEQQSRVQMKQQNENDWTLPITALNRICFIVFSIAFCVLLLSCIFG